MDSISAFILVYDASNAESFNNLTKWLELCKAQKRYHSLGVLVANKTDKQDIQVPHATGEAVAKKHKLGFFTASAVCFACCF